MLSWTLKFKLQLFYEVYVAEVQSYAVVCWERYTEMLVDYKAFTVRQRGHKGIFNWDGLTTRAAQQERSTCRSEERVCSSSSNNNNN